MRKAVIESECLVGKLYRADGKAWRITADLRRHDGRFLFIRWDEDKRIVMQEVLLDRTCIIEGEVNDREDTEAEKKGTGSQTAMCKGSACGDLEER
jgi:hypothetical protein